MANFIIGTAGHVDHGKTSLIKALTGIDTDRLPQEKERGLTLDLGFSRIKMSSGEVYSIVDVPGHEKYLKNMLAGVGGFDFSLLVVDAAEGIMPQTVEHFEILRLLEVQGGIIVITKIDKADLQRISTLEEEMKQLVKGSFLENAPVVKVSSTEGKGIPELVLEIQKGMKGLKPRDDSLPGRLAVDRVFSKPGFGTIVTGAMYQGAMLRDRMVAIQPSNKKTKIRRIQFHDADVDKAYAGQRIALNLARIETEEIRRGDQVAPLGYLSPTLDLDVVVEVLASSPHPLKNRDEVRLYITTHEGFAKVILLEADKIEPGQRGFARLILTEKTAAMAGDKFILRAPSAIYTIGGGRVLDTAPQKHRRFDKRVADLLRLKETGDSLSLLEAIMHREKFRIFNHETLSAASNIDLVKLNGILRELDKEGGIYNFVTGGFVLEKTIQELGNLTCGVLEEFETEYPHKMGRKIEEIKKNLPEMEDRLFREILIELKKSDKIVEKKGRLSSTGFEPRLDPETRKCVEWIRGELEKPGFSPPSTEELNKSKKFKKSCIDNSLDYLVYMDEIVFIDERIIFSRVKLDQSRRLIGHHIIKNGAITPSDAKKILDTSRKYIIPLLEFFDREYFTRRVKDKRVLFRKTIIEEVEA